MKLPNLVTVMCLVFAGIQPANADIVTLSLTIADVQGYTQQLGGTVPFAAPYVVLMATTDSSLISRTPGTAYSGFGGPMTIYIPGVIQTVYKAADLYQSVNVSEPGAPTSLRFTIAGSRWPLGVVATDADLLGYDLRTPFGPKQVAAKDFNFFPGGPGGVSLRTADGTTLYFKAGPVGTLMVDVGNAATRLAVEFYNAALDHYFVTWVAEEIAKLDDGTEIKGWSRTGLAFRSYSASLSTTSSVCRFYIPPELGDSHFYGRDPAECAATAQKNPRFVLEDATFMNMVLPTVGQCPVGTDPVYRVFSNRRDANHRYMVDTTVRNEMMAKGWTVEGDGPDLVVMCAPR